MASLMIENQNRFEGVFTALITPFDATGSIDWDGFKKLVSAQIESGVSGVVPCGTTGESPTLSLEEKRKVIETCVTMTKGTSLRVIAGTGSNQTRESVEFSKWASDVGVDGVLVVTPYYNKPTQAGLIQHFTTIADAVSCEVVLYNVPGRTGVCLSSESIARLSKHSKINHIKEATGDCVFAGKILNDCRAQETEITLLSGDDPTYWPLLQCGAKGTISVASNLIPKVMNEMTDCQKNRNYDRGLQLHLDHLELFQMLFCESNPIPIKYAMHLNMGLNQTLRLPMTALSVENQNRLKSLLEKMEIVS